MADDSLITHCACWHSILLSSPCRWNTLTHVRGHIRDFTSERKERKLRGRIFWLVFEPIKKETELDAVGEISCSKLQKFCPELTNSLFNKSVFWNFVIRRVQITWVLKCLYDWKRQSVFKWSLEDWVSQSSWLDFCSHKKQG